MEDIALKVQSIRDYLSKQFPESKVEAFQDGGHSGPFVFRLDHGQNGNVLHRAIVPSEVMRDLTVAHILDCLSRWDLAARLRESGKQPVVVTREGLQVETQLANPSR